MGADPSAGCAPQAPETIRSSKLLGRVGKKINTKTVELAIKYEWPSCLILHVISSASARL